MYFYRIIPIINRSLRWFMFCWVYVHANRIALCFKKFNVHKGFHFSLKIRHVYKSNKIWNSFWNFKEGRSGRKIGRRLIIYAYTIQRQVHAHSRLTAASDVTLSFTFRTLLGPSRIPVTHKQGPGTTHGNWGLFFCSAQTPVPWIAFPISSSKSFCKSA